MITDIILCIFYMNGKGLSLKSQSLLGMCVLHVSFDNKLVGMLLNKAAKSWISVCVVVTKTSLICCGWWSRSFWTPRGAALACNITNISTLSLLYCLFFRIYLTSPCLHSSSLKICKKVMRQRCKKEMMQWA